MKSSRFCTLILTLSLAAFSCGRGKTSTPQAETQPKPLPTREFPRIDAASRIIAGSQLDIICYGVEHFWDDYFADLNKYRTDDRFVGGVERTPLEEAFGVFATLLWNVPPESAAIASAHLYDQLAAADNPTVAEIFIQWMEHYLYDPNSPLRSEDFYLPFLEKLAEGDLAQEDLRPQYEFQTRMCRLNRMGTPAADFSFTDTRGRKRTLYGIDAEFLLLIFGNPDCHACTELTETISADPGLSAMIQTGRVKVVDIFIDQEVDEWKSKIPTYPKDWINGYDHNFLIRQDQLYHIRAIPSMYLLDRDKNVILRDAPEEILLTFLSSLN